LIQTQNRLAQIFPKDLDLIIRPYAFHDSSAEIFRDHMELPKRRRETSRSLRFVEESLGGAERAENG